VVHGVKFSYLGMCEIGLLAIRRKKFIAEVQYRRKVFERPVFWHNFLVCEYYSLNCYRGYTVICTLDQVGSRKMKMRR
jgi:hypothetical protein